jgi:general L-amino acid transport system substrate-binding protein
MKYCKFIALLVVCYLFLATLSLTVQAGETLDAVKSRGWLRCGVSEGIAGFSEKDASGLWTGFDVDFCRAVAAAALGDSGKVVFVPLKASERFPALQSRIIDLLLRNTTWTIGREAGLKVQFPGILFYDGQAFMVRGKAAVKKITQLNGATVCVEKGTTHVQNLADYFGARGMKVIPLVLESTADVTSAFFTGRCHAYTSDASQLAAVRLGAPGGPQSLDILRERISKEPLGPVVRRGDDDWFTLIRWVVFALIAAEEAGITRDNIAVILKETHDPVLRRAFGIDGGFGKALGVGDDWAVQAVKAAGNYGEIFERNVGHGSTLKLDRGLNRLWTQGGLMYAPPLR